MSAPRSSFAPLGATPSSAGLPGGRLLYSAREVAAMLGRTHLAVLRAIERGEAGESIPPAVRIGRQWFFPAEPLYSWAQRLAQAAESNTPLHPRCGRPRGGASQPSGQTLPSAGIWRVRRRREPDAGSPGKVALP